MNDIELNEAEPMTDAQGEAFDPELHASKPDGSPALKTDGTFRKKRRDAGGSRRTTTSTRAKAAAAAAPPQSMPRALKEQHARHKKALRDTGGVLLLFASFASPLDAYTLEPLADPMADALATLAQDNPQLAAAWDKLGGAGAVTTAVGIVAVAAVQVLHNHDKVPEKIAKMMGAKPKAQALTEMGAHAEALKAQAAERAQEQAAFEAMDAAMSEEMADA